MAPEHLAAGNSSSSKTNRRAEVIFSPAPPATSSYVSDLLGRGGRGKKKIVKKPKIYIHHTQIEVTLKGSLSY